MPKLTCLEICAGAGGQSLGLENAGFSHTAAVELDTNACATLRLNRPSWNVVERDVHMFDGTTYAGVDLLAGGVPCPPFSIAGKQLGGDDDRDLFPQALRLVRETSPKAVMLENVRGLSTARFARYRQQILDVLEDELGYVTEWQVLNSSEYGVPQLRPRFILVALRPDAAEHFAWPAPEHTPPTVGMSLRHLMAAQGWKGADAWAARANGIGPTLVGGSKKHGGADLGPTRAREGWRRLHVDGRGIANEPPQAGDPLDLMPKLTLEMAAVIQGFPAAWKFAGKKTANYRQIGNAFPPPVAEAVGISIKKAIRAAAAAERKEQREALRLVAS